MKGKMKLKKLLKLAPIMLSFYAANAHSNECSFNIGEQIELEKPSEITQRFDYMLYLNNNCDSSNPEELHTINSHNYKKFSKSERYNKCYLSSNLVSKDDRVLSKCSKPQLNVNGPVKFKYELPDNSELFSKQILLVNLSNSSDKKLLTSYRNWLLENSDRFHSIYLHQAPSLQEGYIKLNPLEEINIESEIIMSDSLIHPFKSLDHFIRKVGKQFESFDTAGLTYVYFGDIEKRQVGNDNFINLVGSAHFYLANNLSIISSQSNCSNIWNHASLESSVVYCGTDFDKSR